MEHAVDLHRADRRTLQRGQQHPTQRVAQRQAKSALQRLGHDAGLALGIAAWLDVQLVRLDHFGPVFLNHGIDL